MKITLSYAMVSALCLLSIGLGSACNNNYAASHDVMAQSASQALESAPPAPTTEEKTDMMEPNGHCEDEWRAVLTDEQYYVMREHGTESAFTNAYYNHQEDGVYHCAGCDQPLFSSEHKYQSGTGWPSYWQPITQENIGLDIDRRFGMSRTEVHCKRCGGHLGHVFNDGPQPTGLRYCINSASLQFKAADAAADATTEEAAEE